MFDLSGKVAVVTGGSRGIGRATALALAKHGSRVVITYAGNEDAARATVAAIEAAGGSARSERFDVGDMTAAEQGIASIAKAEGRLDILVANAGISRDALLLRIKEDDIDRTLAVNLKGVIGCAKGALKTMMRAKAGRVIFMSSVVGETGNVGQTAYAASKAGLLGVMKSLSKEYASRGITFNSITPGYIQTDMTESISDEAKQAMLNEVPLNRAGTADEVAAAAVYLSSDEAGYVTGNVLRVNGGMYM